MELSQFLRLLQFRCSRLYFANTIESKYGLHQASCPSRWSCPYSFYLALAIGHRAGVGGLTQPSFTSSLLRRAGGDRPGGALIGHGRVVVFALPPPSDEALLVVVAPI